MIKYAVINNKALYTKTKIVLRVVGVKDHVTGYMQTTNPTYQFNSNICGL